MHTTLRQNGVDLPSVQHEGQSWVLAPPDGDYEIVLYNNCGKRRCAVVTVDGLSVIDGQEGKRDGEGYVLEPWQRLVIPGWHRTDREVARFQFTPNEGSYSNKTGKGKRNTGIIAVAVFDEKFQPQIQFPQVIIQRPVVIREVYPLWWYPSPRPYYHQMFPIHHDTIICGSAGLNAGDTSDIGLATSTFTMSNAVHDGGPAQMFACSASVDSEPIGAGMEAVMDSAPVSNEELAQMDLGTGYGSRAEMYTRTVSFERATKKPAEEVVIRYGTRERLAALGVPVQMAKAPAATTPDPFPGSSCPAPAGWAG